jgi:hypothetical protein
MTDNTQKRVRVRALKTTQDCVAENSAVYSKFMRGEIARSDASVASSIITNSRSMIEGSKTEDKLASLEEKFERFVANQASGNVVQFKRQA